MTSASLEPLTFDPHDYRFHADPHPTYRCPRTEVPDPEFWAVSRQGDYKLVDASIERVHSTNVRGGAKLPIITEER
ncbi:hypothetical protein [Nocardia pseudovaccinii]|uniref:hypothetical protein n=1 Tax=Nocardia pseudovaccinii TaxID=189540 RepID=UPI0012F52AE7